MPKKQTKKIYSMLRRSQQTAKRNRLRSQKAKEQLRQRMLGFARSEKEGERISNANNTTHTVPISPINEETVNNNSNTISTVEPINNVRWSTEPNELQILGYQRKGKQRANKILTAKQKRQQQFEQTRKQRGQQRGKERQFKEQEQVWPSNSTEKILLNAEAEEEARQKQAFENEIAAIMDGWYINNNNNNNNNMNYNINYNKMEREREEEEMRKATEIMNTMPKNRFYIRIDNARIINSTEFFRYLNRPRFRLGHKLEFLYLSENPRESYYEILKYNPAYNPGENNSSYEDYNSDFEVEEGYKAYRQEPAAFFKSTDSSDTYDWFTDRDYNMYNARYTRFIPIWNIRRYIRNMPHLYEEFERITAATIRGRAKLQELQMKGVEGAIQQFEQKTGETVPQNVQNIIEQFIKPIDYRYYQGRDNLRRIKTNLFTDGVVDVPRNLKKINTSLFQNEETNV